VTAAAARYRALSLWHDTVDDDLGPRPPLVGDLEVDIAIIGGGLTGLWTAHHLLERDPGLSIAVIEREIAGFGASGRNGGWCSALFPRSAASLEAAHGRPGALAMRRAMVGSVDAVGASARELGIACDYAKGGTVSLIRSPAQRRAADAEVAAARAYGVDPLERVEVGGREAVLDPNCARVHPAALVRGLARSLETRGVRILEGTPALDWRPGAVQTPHGDVHARSVLAALEGYTATTPRGRRTTLPLYSLMIATEPLPEEVWERIGISHGTTFTDYRHLLVYGQRTADDRIAFGGRGARYHLGSAVRPAFDRVEAVFRHLRRALVDLFPEVAPYAVTHRWGGPLGVARDWHASVRYDPATGLGSAGGYVGDGLSTTHLAGRTLADLVTGADTELTRLPWVGHASPRWEPEPLRFLGANAGLTAMALADVEERLTARPSAIARVMAPLVGH